jgi:hypothetical protein
VTVKFIGGGHRSSLSKYFMQTIFCCCEFVMPCIYYVNFILLNIKLLFSFWTTLWFFVIYLLFMDHNMILLWFTNSFWTIIWFFFDLPTLFGPSYYSLIYLLFLDHHIILLWFTYSFWTIIWFFFDLLTLFGPSYYSSLIYLLFLDHHNDGPKRVTKSKKNNMMVQKELVNQRRIIWWSKKSR